MQDRYVGDIGDYVKLAILRTLSPGRRLGVAWWLYPHKGPDGDGRHVDYLDNPDRWRAYDPPLFDLLRSIVRDDRRTVETLELGLPSSALIARESIPGRDTPVAHRSLERAQWFSRVTVGLAEADFIFADPDNGLEPKTFSLGQGRAGKSITLAELKALDRPGRCLLVYHHHTRMKGGHDFEIGHWAARLRDSGFTSVDALRAKPYSPRVFFLLNAPQDIRLRAEALARTWGDLITWHPDQGSR